MAESFSAALKNELGYRTVFSTRKKARQAIAEYIEVLSRTQAPWLHGSLGNVPPVEFEQTHYAALNPEPQPT